VQGRRGVERALGAERAPSAAESAPTEVPGGNLTAAKGEGPRAADGFPLGATGGEATVRRGQGGMRGCTPGRCRGTRTGVGLQMLSTLPR